MGGLDLAPYVSRRVVRVASAVAPVRTRGSDHGGVDHQRCVHAGDGRSRRRARLSGARPEKGRHAGRQRLERGRGARPVCAALRGQPAAVAGSAVVAGAACRPVRLFQPARVPLRRARRARDTRRDCRVYPAQPQRAVPAGCGARADRAHTFGRVSHAGVRRARFHSLRPHATGRAARRTDPGRGEADVRVGAIVIGEEIIRGKREDKHFPKLISILGSRGMRLHWCEYLGDMPDLITATLRRTLASGDLVFSFGGIGATPDDHTRQCAADALGLELVLHPDAEAAIRSRTDMEITPQRLKMGEFPRGSRIIPNPYNKIPGFSVGDHHFVPGFPVMAWPMVEWVLDHRYADLFHLTPEAEAAIIVYDLPESTITPLMLEVESSFRRLKSFSLPSMGEQGVRRHIELGVRGAPEEVTPAIEQMKLGVAALGGRWEEKP